MTEHFQNGIKMKTFTQEWYDNGQLATEVHKVDDQLHNETGPAYQEWYENGQPRRVGYYFRGKSHNETGPAFLEWYENGQMKVKIYSNHGKYHNENGLAYCAWLPDGDCYRSQYWINNEELSKEEFLERMSTVAQN